MKAARQAHHVNQPVHDKGFECYSGRGTGLPKTCLVAPSRLTSFPPESTEKTCCWGNRQKKPGDCQWGDTGHNELIDILHDDIE